MLALALETSVRHGSCALGKLGHGEPIQRQLSAQAPHLSLLMPEVAALFDELGASPRELGAVFVGTGPGSYTGLRVGISTALGLAVGPEPPALYGIPSPEALFFAALEEGQAGTWITDARRGTWYRARALRKAGQLELTTPPELVPSAELDPAPPGRLFTDTASKEPLEELLGPAAHFEVQEPSARALWQLGARYHKTGVEPTPPGALAPLYLRAFDAKVRAR